MPDSFDSSKLGFSSGSYGSVENDNISYIVVGNTITGSYNGLLDSNKGITMRVELPDNYFVKQKGSKLIYLMYIIPLLGLVISFLLWYKYGKDNMVVETVEFYPPEGLNSLDLGFAYKGKAVKNDVISLIIYLANQGYIKISEGDKKNDFVLTKVKDYDGTDELEKIFMTDLFKNRDSVSKANLEEKFYTTINEIVSKKNSKENREKIFEKNRTSKIVLIGIFVVISIFVLGALPNYIEYGFFDNFYSILFLIPFIIVILVPDLPMIFKIVFGVNIAAASFAIFNVPMILSMSTYTIPLIIGLVAIIGMIVLATLMPKRNSYGTELLGKIRGFKNFLETAEKEKLEALVNENHEYFYNILPYTYVLGVSSKWIKKFEAIALEPPTWYYADTFDYLIFSSFIDDTFSMASSAMTSRPVESSSGGFGGFSGGSSGGGFSGGGAGGGGGSSW